MKILVVDDSRTDLALLTAMLSEIGHAVLPANSGEQALQLFLAQMPDMVLIDVVMPGMDGYETVRQMRRIAGEHWIPILFVTALGKEDDIACGAEAGGDDYLLKPVHPKILRAKINALQNHLQLFRRIEEQSSLLLDYQINNEEEQHAASEFMHRLLALDKINDPLVHFHLRPANVFSGDLIAVASSPAGQRHVMLADSTGHGLTAALAVMPVLQSFSTMSEKGYSIGTIAAEINRKIREYFPPSCFIAAVLVALDAENNRVSVWNGGCPPAALLDAGGEVIYPFRSMHLPLGVLDVNEFDETVTSFHYGKRNCQLLLFSDGALGGVDSGDTGNGMAQFMEVARAVEAPRRLHSMVDLLDRTLAGKRPHDDIALVLVDCPAEAAEVLAVAGEAHADARVPDAIAGRETNGQAAKAEWQLELAFSAPQLRQVDIVPMLTQIVNQIECESLQAASGKLFLVLSELFNNALDHGLLELDSTLKNDSASGMDRYFEERSKRLGALDQGEIRINLEKTRVRGEPCLKITVADSGKGFDYTALREGALDFGTRRHGRGIALVTSMTGQFPYSGKGNQAHACIPLTGSGQCAACREEEGGFVQPPSEERNTQ
jgi:DNA-binding response OmpR family regulator/anti-sigma regulatory factor (Ser/Thr protein kinase)